MSPLQSKILKRSVVAVIVLGVAAGLWTTSSRWLPVARAQASRLYAWLTARDAPRTDQAATEAGHTEHAHEHAGHDETTALELSEQAQRNIGLKTGQVTRGTFVRTVTIPGMVVERPGATKTRVVAPVTGIITRVHAIEGEAVPPGRPLFDLRMTHEDVLQAQVEFLKTVEELDVVNREVDRLRPVAEKGAIPQKSLLDRLYEQQKLVGSLRAQRESLLLHGLSEEQVREIEQARALRSRLTIYAPGRRPAEESPAQSDDRLLVIHDLSVEPGRLVGAGDPLLTLADYAELYIEGNAFEQDGRLVASALRNAWKVTALVENSAGPDETVPDLGMLYLSDEVDPASRTLHFYLALKNERIRDAVTDGHRFINWRFKPGQRTQLRVPVEEWDDRIVLPADAIAQDGPESYVFQQNGGHFDRRAVQIEYRDLYSVVIAQDGALFPGDVVAFSGAQQMLMALKNKSGGAADPHAGHGHSH